MPGKCCSDSGNVKLENSEKCTLELTEVEFLGYLILSQGFQMNPVKVQALLDWVTPQTRKDIQHFLGFANYYRKFLWDFSVIASPLSKQLKGK